MFNPNAKPEQFDRELIPEGAHKARCARVIELGEHLSGFPQEDGKEEYPKNKAVIVLSLPDVIMSFGDLGDKQAFVSRPFGITMSTGDRAIMPQYAKALDPQKEGTDLGYFVNKVCQVSIIHKERKDKPTISIIDSIAPILPGTPVGELDTTPFWFQWNDPDPELLKLIPEFTRDLMKSAVNYPDSRVERLMEQMDQEPSVEVEEEDLNADAPF